MHCKSQGYNAPRRKSTHPMNALGCRSPGFGGIIRKIESSAQLVYPVIMTPKKEETAPKGKPLEPAGVGSEAKDKNPGPRVDPERTFLKEALTMARHLNVDYILFICDESAPFTELVRRGLKKKIIVATSSEKTGMLAEEQGLTNEIIPGYAYERFEKIKIALASCVSAGKMTHGMQVLCLVSKPNSAIIDTCMVTQVGHHSEEQAALGAVLAGSGVSSQVLESILHIALSVGFEGIEGDPVGTIFVVGDSTAVMEKSKQLTLNPFQGYSEDEKNILDPKIRDAIKNFCLLDGAFIIREDGVVLAAGRYLRVPEELELDLPLGLGTRNASAMAISKVTRALSFVVSKTTGAVRVYKDGKLAVEIKQPRRRT
jgi:diadenylate cyclase